MGVKDAWKKLWGSESGGHFKAALKRGGKGALEHYLKGESGFGKEGIKQALKKGHEAFKSDRIFRMKMKKYAKRAYRIHKRKSMRRCKCNK